VEECFGRYWTLGFAQGYRDPNRQAIHDRISATVVLDLLPKIIAKYHYHKSPEEPLTFES